METVHVHAEEFKQEEITKLVEAISKVFRLHLPLNGLKDEERVKSYALAFIALEESKRAMKQVLRDNGVEIQEVTDHSQCGHVFFQEGSDDIQ